MVKVGGYCIDSTEVTNSQYGVFLAAAGSNTSGQPSYCAWNTTYSPDGTPACAAAAKTNSPVVCVDWCDAYAYCKWAGKRLCGKIGGAALAPSDAVNAAQSQWYNACSAGGTKTYPYAGSYKYLECNGSGYGAGATIPVNLVGCEGGYAGIHDMSGNAWEWEDSCTGTAGAQDKCLLRGGAFTSDSSQLVCTFVASGNGRSFTNNSIGFRCCSD